MTPPYAKFWKSDTLSDVTVAITQNPEQLRQALKRQHVEQHQQARNKKKGKRKQEIESAGLFRPAGRGYS